MNHNCYRMLSLTAASNRVYLTVTGAQRALQFLLHLNLREGLDDITHLNVVIVDQ